MKTWVGKANFYEVGQILLNFSYTNTEKQKYTICWTYFTISEAAFYANVSLWTEYSLPNCGSNFIEGLEGNQDIEELKDKTEDELKDGRSDV